VTGEGYLNFARRLVAQERNRHIGEFKPAFVRAASGAPNELLPFLHELAGIDGLITEFLELAADCESRPKDSNSEMSPQIIPLKARTDSPGPSQSSGHRDYSRLSCGVAETQLRRQFIPKAARLGSPNVGILKDAAEGRAPTELCLSDIAQQRGAI